VRNPQRRYATDVFRLALLEARQAHRRITALR
jgi:hypothetical protein